MKLLEKFSWKIVPPAAACLIVFIAVFFFANNPAIMGNMILLAFVVGTIPYLLINYLEIQRTKAIEDQLPIFMLDMSEAMKTGTTLPNAFKIISATDYGRLTPEIIKITNQLSWGVTLQDALESFATRLKKSGMVGRVVRIITEAYNSGGNVGRALEATAADMLTIREAENERKAVGQQNTAIMYVIYFIFIGIILGVSKMLVPMLEINTEGSGIGGIMAFSDPCTACLASSHIYCISCKTFGFICQMFNFGGGAVCYYYSLFFAMAVMQGILAGLVAGQISEGSVISGLKHSLIMTVTGSISLLILLQVI